MSASEHLDVRSAYDRWAASYDAIDNPMVYAATHAFVAGLPNVMGKDCVEFGCGTGRNLAHMAQAGARTITGLDFSDGMLTHARLRAQQMPGQTWALIQHDMCTPVPLPTSATDFVLFVLTLEHIDDLSRALSHAKNLLRVDGCIRIIEIHPFMSFNGVGAHFLDEGVTITMPTFPHQFEQWIIAIGSAGLVINSLREWRAMDFGVDAPDKIKRRGLQWPWLIDFTLTQS